jgi:hypothetical protein
MADVFISYASEDRDRAGRLANALSAEGWSVWWDRKIIAGQPFDHAIEFELESAKSVVVLWSRHSVESEWVKNEAAVAAEGGVLVPALIDSVKLPLEFRRKQTADLIGWQGDPSHGGYQALCEGIAATMGNTAPRQRAIAKEKNSRGTPRWLWPGLAVVAIAVGFFAYSMRAPGKPPPLPKPLRLTVATDDQADQVEIKTTPIDGTAGRLKVCLQVQTRSGWWKGIGLNESEPTLEGEKSDGLKCTTIDPSLINVAYWKAKEAGRHAPVGTRPLDLRQYKDHEVIFTWRKD